MNELGVLTSKMGASNSTAGNVRNLRSEARITSEPPRAFPWYVRLIHSAQRRKYGQELEPARLWGRIPRAFLALTLLYRWIDRKGSPIEPSLRALIQVRVSQINWCDFCVDLNSAVALERHVLREKLATLATYDISPAFNEKERVALAFAEAMTDPHRGVDDQLFARLRRSYGEDAVIELTALVAFQNLSSKFNSALGVPAKGFCASPEL